MANVFFYISAAPGAGAWPPMAERSASVAAAGVAGRMRGDPAVRGGLVSAVREMLAAGTYDERGKVEAVADRILVDLDVVA